MSHPSLTAGNGPSRGVRRGTAPTRDRVAWLGLGALALTVAVFVVPMLFLSSRGYAAEPALVAAAGSAFATSDTAASAPLGDLVGLWGDFHLVKAALAAALVVVLLLIEGRLRQALGARPRRPIGAVGAARAAGPAAAYAGCWLWLLGAVTLLPANLQGAAAPLASAASLLPTERPSAEVASTLTALRGQLGSEGSVGHALLSDFTRYHVVFVVLAALVGVWLTVVAVRALLGRWRERASLRPALGWLWRVGIAGPAGGFFLLVALANLSTALHPEQGLLAFLGGGH